MYIAVGFCIVLFCGYVVNFDKHAIWESSEAVGLSACATASSALLTLQIVPDVQRDGANYGMMQGAYARVNAASANRASC